MKYEFAELYDYVASSRQNILRMNRALADAGLYKFWRRQETRVEEFLQELDLPDNIINWTRNITASEYSRRVSSGIYKKLPETFYDRLLLHPLAEADDEITVHIALVEEFLGVEVRVLAQVWCPLPKEELSLMDKMGWLHTEVVPASTSTSVACHVR